jgi:hypothetical protein
MLARLLLTILDHKPLQSKGLRISNGRRGGRQGLDVKKNPDLFLIFFLLVCSCGYKLTAHLITKVVFVAIVGNVGIKTTRKQFT